MPIETTHTEYTQRSDQWRRCRDAFAGGDAVKAQGTRYLPRLDSQTPDEYDAYVLRALWYGATARTVEGLTGAVTRKDPKFDVPDAMLSHLDDITLTGQPLTIFTKCLFIDLLQTGRVGVLLDRPGEADPAKADSTRPYWTTYCAEQIINWRTTVENGKQILVMVVLKEFYEQVDDDDMFETESQERYRVLLMDSGTYIQHVYTKAKDSEEYTIEEIRPTFRGMPLDFIPFCFFGIKGLEPCPEKPPLLDLADVNFSHYRSSADLEHGRHFTALPTPWIAGFPKDTKLRIGSTVAWVSSDPQAHAGMLEFTGQGLNALEKAMESKERLMAVLGARMLEEQKPSVEAAATLMQRYSGERSTLQSMAIVVGLGLTQVLRWHATWMGIKDTDKINAELNSDFMATPMTGPELTALFQVYQGGGISYETWYWNLQRGEVARPDVEAEDEEALIEEESAKRLIEEVNAMANGNGNEDEDLSKQDSTRQSAVA